MAPQPVILFDGVCNLCNRAVQYVIRHDPAAKFKFASLQSKQGQDLLSQYKLDQNDLSSIVLLQDDKFYTRSTAALKVARQLKGAVRFLYGFIIVPSFIRNAVYNIIAKKRYSWFGKRQECMIPTATLQHRFLNE